MDGNMPEPIRQTENTLTVVHTVKELRAVVGQWQRDGLRVGLVPTMGALHDGHLSPVKKAQETTNKVVVSIFVNPLQFSPSEDFDVYPRPERADIAVLQDAGVDLLYMPSVDEMFPDGFQTKVTLSDLTAGLCGRFRADHFDGVATIVTKLLNQCGADAAVFGEKDFQQLRVIQSLARDLDIATEILGARTVRDADGLATSSRNVYLSDAEREIALALPCALRDIAKKLLDTDAAIEDLMQCGREAMEQAGFDEVEYFELCDADTLAPMKARRGAARLLSAACVGKTRLIDNLEIRFGS